LREIIDQPKVVFDDLQHADAFLQGSAAKLVADGEVFLAAQLQVGTQDGSVPDMEVAGAGHPEAPR
jgi:hypothetical protein